MTAWKSARRRGVDVGLLLSTGLLGVMLAPGTASAACDPNPPKPYTVTTCTGNDPAGVVISVDGSTVNVDSAATVSTVVATSRATVLSPYVFNNSTVNVNGSVLGGLLVNGGTIDAGVFGFTNTTANLVLGASGTISGTTAIRLTGADGRALLSVDNSGSIQSAAGPAILSGDPGKEAILALTNRSSGTIGAIRAMVGSLDNRGLIDGGSLSALSYADSAGVIVFPSSWSNSGTIQSSSTLAVIDFPTVVANGFLNSGQIINLGAGAAIDAATQSLQIVNDVGGTIGSAGSTAIRSGGYSFGMANRGTVNGDIIATTSSSYLDNRSGTINGSVVFGTGDDRLIARTTDGQNVAGITGTIDGGAGIDILELIVSSNLTLTSVALANNFENVQYDLDNANLTLNLATVPVGGLSVRGTGTLTNAGNITSNSTAIRGQIVAQNVGFEALKFVNTGSISATLSQTYEAGVSLIGGLASFTNSGTINAVGGGGVNVSFNDYETGLNNTGLIQATDTAVRATGLFSNSGTIRSTAGVGVDTTSFGGIGSTISTNSGRIEGAVEGLRISGTTVVNSGTITSTGIAVSLGYYGTFENKAGGVVTGGTRGVGLPGGSGAVFNGRLINAGTINGNVDFGTDPFSYYGSNNIVIAQPGGIINGNLNLGSGNDIFVTSLTNNGPGQYAGVTGTVTGGPNEKIRYIVDRDTSAMLALPGIFSSVGYELSNNAKLTLTSATPQTMNVEFAGVGSVDLAADITAPTGTFGAGDAVLNLDVASVLGNESFRVDLISRGTLTGVNTTQYSSGSIVRNGGGTFTNAGTIIMDDQVINYFGSLNSAISGPGTVINDGMIKVGGASGIASGFGGGPFVVINNGSIRQIAGAVDATGISGIGTFTNNGLINTAGSAALLRGGGGFRPNLTNNGNLQSTNAVTVRSADDYQESWVVNNAAGVISGVVGMPTVGLAVGSVLENAGTINGNVNLAYTTQNYYTPYRGSAYISRGGTINGNLTFGAGDDIFVAVGPAAAITGSIDAGDGNDLYVRGYTTSTTVDAGAGTLPATFERFGIGAIGRDVTVTVTGSAGGLDTVLSYFGDGTLINRANINTRPNPDPNAGASLNYSPINVVSLNNFGGGISSLSALNFVNEARLDDGVVGTVRAFSNSGTIGLPTLAVAAVALNAADAPNFSFANSGLIQKNGSNNFFGPTGAVRIFDNYNNVSQPRQSTILTNSGAIKGGIAARLLTSEFNFSNTGLITAEPFWFGLSVPVQLTLYSGADNPANSTASIVNDGIIDGNVQATSYLRTLNFDNSNRITSGVALRHINTLPDDADLTRVNLTNSGTIISQGGTATLSLDSQSSAVTFSNSGIMTLNAGSNYPAYYVAVSINNLTNSSQTASFSNSGSITAAQAGSSGVVIAAAASFTGASPLLPPVPDAATAGVTFINTGSINANAGAIYRPLIPSPYPWIPDQPSQLFPVSALTISAQSQGASTINFTNGATGIVSSTGATVIADGFPGATVPPTLNVMGSTAFVAIADKVIITNDGKISGSPGGTLPNDVVLGLPGTSLDIVGQFLAGAILTLDSTDTLINNKTGTITGSIDLGTFDDVLQNFGTITGNVYLRDGNDGFVQSLSGALNGVADGGAGTDLLTIDINGGGLLSQSLLNKFVNFENTVFTGTGTVTTNGPLAMNTFTLSGGHMTIAAGSTLQTSGSTTIMNVAGNNSITNFGTVAGNVSNAATFTNGVGGVTGTVINSATASNAGTIASLSNTGGTFANTGTAIGATNVSGGTLTTTGTLGGGLTNAALINANGGAVNGPIINSADGTINIGGVVAGSGAFTNSATTATLNVNAGSLTLAGLLTNSGRITVASAAVLTATVGGIRNNAGGIITVSAGGTLNDALSNAGVVNNAGTYNADVNNGGTNAITTNAAAGVWTGNVLTNATGASVINQGRWVGTATNAATLTNAIGATWSGVISNGASGSFINNGSVVGSVTNSGTTTINVSGTVSGLLTNSSGTTINAGQLNGGAVVGGGTLNNIGTISGPVANAASFTNVSGGKVSGLLTNSAGTTVNIGQLNSGVNVTGGALNTSGVIAGGLTNAAIVNATGGAVNGGIVNQGSGTMSVAGMVTSDGSFNNAAATSILNLNSGSLTLGGALSNNGIINFNGGALISSAINNQAGGTINGSINFGNSNGLLTNAGRIAGSQTWGTGNDQLTIRAGATFGGAVDGGAGSDLLIIAATGTDATPDEFNLTNITGFERTRHDSGTAALSGALSTGILDIVAGRLIGRSGSTITASTVIVGTGSVFGSAGTVNSNVVVNGTLSPGASPGTMNVVGNVSLAAGSISLFEITPTVSDQLLISGALNIAPTAVLTLTGARPLTPGSSLDLIVANGGITGGFGTINKAAGVFGFVAQRGNRISLLGEFLVDPVFNSQTARTVTYVNSVLTSGQASAGLLAAIPSLLTAGGATNATAFARLNPEAYASVTQIGTENGLAIASALRSAGGQTYQDEAGLFTFAEGLGAWRKLPGNAAVGTARANVSSSGVLGGIGFGSKSASLGAFIGYLNARQTIDALGARNKADGIVAGVSGHLSSGGFDGSATLAYDGSSANTTRSLPGAANASASYSMRSITADVSLGYRLPVVKDWSVKPQLGFTSIWTKRDAVNETGTSPFNLTVAAGREHTSFADGAVELRREAGALRPWIRFGLRHLLKADNRDATAVISGATSSFTIQGVSRESTFGTVGAGLTALVGKGISIFASYEGEFGNDATGHKVHTGMRIAF